VGLFLSGTSAMSLGCQQQASGNEAHARIQPTYDKSGRLTRLSYDSNNNGKDDTWAYMEGARLVRLEADENEDGHIDRWEYYPVGSGAAPLKQPPERIERSSRADGRISRRELFQGGALANIEEDTDDNGVMDKWETYVGGALTMLALDTSGHGKPDRRLIYKADGSLDRIEVDPAGAGHFQRLRP
jgi:hypothetical protein